MVIRSQHYIWHASLQWTAHSLLAKGRDCATCDLALAPEALCPKETLLPIRAMRSRESCPVRRVWRRESIGLCNQSPIFAGEMESRVSFGARRAGDNVGNRIL